MKFALRAGVIGAAFLALAAMPDAQSTSPLASIDWRSYAGDLRNQHYSPLGQVDAGNFNRLEVAWRFKTDNLGPRLEYKLEGTPLMVKGTSMRPAARADRWSRSTRRPAN